MCTMSPEITGPRFVMWLDTMTAIIDETVAGGGGLLPGRVVQVWPHHGEALLRSKPLKLAGARPARIGSAFHHCAPQKVTDLPMPFSRSPITKAPPPGA